MINKKIKEEEVLKKESELKSHEFLENKEEENKEKKVVIKKEGNQSSKIIMLWVFSILFLPIIIGMILPDSVEIGLYFLWILIFVPPLVFLFKNRKGVIKFVKETVNSIVDLTKLVTSSFILIGVFILSIVIVLYILRWIVHFLIY